MLGIGGGAGPSAGDATAGRLGRVAGVDGVLPLAEVERRYILAVLEKTGWVIKGPRGTAEALGLPVSTLRGRMRKLGIRRPR